MAAARARNPFRVAVAIAIGIAREYGRGAPEVESQRRGQGPRTLRHGRAGRAEGRSIADLLLPSGRHISLSMTTRDAASGYMTGRLLVAMPTIGDPRFEKTVIYMCAHSEEGAMGLVVNKLLGALTVSQLMSQLSLDASPLTAQMPVHFGGPVETGRGFVLHSADHVYEEIGRAHV